MLHLVFRASEQLSSPSASKKANFYQPFRRIFQIFDVFRLLVSNQSISDAEPSKGRHKADAQLARNRQWTKWRLLGKIELENRWPVELSSKTDGRSSVTLYAF